MVKGRAEVDVVCFRNGRWAAVALIVACSGYSDEHDSGPRDEQCLLGVVDDYIEEPGVPDRCTEMRSCAGPEAAFTIDYSLCFSGIEGLYSADGTLLGTRSWTDEAEPRDCADRGETACEDSKLFVAPQCVAYAQDDELDVCAEQESLQHGWFGSTLPEALAASSARCLATARCKVDDEDYVVVASIEPRECLDDNSRRYDVFSAETGTLFSSAWDPAGTEGQARPCGDATVGWSREAMGECLTGLFEASEACGFTLGLPEALVQAL